MMKLILSFLVLLIIMLTDYYTGDYFVQLSLTLIPQLQQIATPTSIRFWLIWTDNSLLFIELVPICITFFKNRHKSFYYICAFCFIWTFMNISKFVYGQPRPFWLSPEIIPYTCSSNYGNPSGHSFVASGFALMIWLDFAPPTVSAKIVIFVAVVVFSCMTGYSRMILGQHSLDQVFYGLALGVWAALTMHYCVRDRLFDHLKRNHYNYADLVLNNTVVLLILLISQIFVSILFKRQFEQQWIENIDKSICTVKFDQAHVIIVSAGTSVVANGCYFGILFQQKYCKYPETGVFTYILVILCGFIFYAIVFATHEIGLTHPVSQLILNQLLPITVCTFACFGLVDYFVSKVTNGQKGRESLLP